jgi:hypothetical protein
MKDKEVHKQQKEWSGGGGVKCQKIKGRGVEWQKTH